MEECSTKNLSVQAEFRINIREINSAIDGTIGQSHLTVKSRQTTRFSWSNENIYRYN